MILVSRRFPGLIYTYRYFLYSLLIVASTLIYFLIKWNLLCTNLQTWQHIKKMCSLYEEGYALGSLCSPVCVTKDIHSLTCHSFQATKEAVFSAKLHDETRLVFKSASAEDKPLHWYDNGSLKYPEKSDFLSAIKALVRGKLNITLNRDEILRLSHLASTENSNQQLGIREIDNIWTLLQDNEYLLGAIYTDRNVFPKLIGTCGGYFAMEYLEPIPDISAMFKISDTREDWGGRLKLSIQILDFLEEIENFAEPFHLCDVKMRHFGLVKTPFAPNKLKFVDLNAVYPRSIVNQNIKNIGKCDKDENCEFFDCRGRCDKISERCLDRVENNNLQIVCEKIFLGWRMSNTVIVPGLLMSQHTPAVLAAILRQCANPDSEDGKPRATPEPEVKKRLYNILTEIEQSVYNDIFP